MENKCRRFRKEGNFNIIPTDIWGTEIPEVKAEFEAIIEESKREVPLLAVLFTGAFDKEIDIYYTKYQKLHGELESLKRKNAINDVRYAEYVIKSEFLKSLRNVCGLEFISKRKQEISKIDNYALKKDFITSVLKHYEALSTALIDSEKRADETEKKRLYEDWENAKKSFNSIIQILKVIGIDSKEIEELKEQYNKIAEETNKVNPTVKGFVFCPYNEMFEK